MTQTMMSGYLSSEPLMTHYALMVLTKTEEENEVHALMKPFDEQREAIPRKIYLDKKEISQMLNTYIQHEPVPFVIPSKEEANELGLSVKDLGEYRFLASKMLDWNGCDGGYDKDGLYKVTKTNPEGYYDYYTIMSSLDPARGFWREAWKELDYLPLKEVDWNLLDWADSSYLPTQVVTPDGLFRRAEDIGWFGSSQELIQESEWKYLYAAIKAQYGDCFAWRLDVHI
ncbi:hypothetical protein N9E35_03240 [Candidatus Marinimicrobia bacterium]|nr:hypothetical protein [Candidatus Neomarinimicrobiota bacterium]